MREIFELSLNAHMDEVMKFKSTNIDDVCAAAKLIIEAVKNQKRIFLFGNGGSAADAQHIAAEFTGRFVNERRPLPAIALTTDTSALTAIGNDYGFEFVFERQVEALAQNGDVLIGISTSGNSANVVRALEIGRKKSCCLITLTGRNGGIIRKISDININIATDVTARIQEMHILVGHLICEAIDDYISREKVDLV